MAAYEYSSGAIRPRAAVFARESGMKDLCAGSLEAGISGSGEGGGGVCSAPFAAFCPPVRRWGSNRALGPLSPGSGGNGGGGVGRFFLDPVCEEEPRHFLDACSMCKKPLRNRDIYMYRGDVPFCSEECRQEQIEIDEAREKSWSLPMKASASRKEQQKQKGKASVQVRAAGTVVVG